MSGSNSHNTFNPNRLESLVDGVLAIILTLLVFDLRAPTAQSDRDLISQISLLWPQLLSFVLSFLVVGVFWYGHRMESHWVVRSDRIHILLTLIYLLVIALIPFSAATMGRNIRVRSAVALFGLNLATATAIRLVIFSYATWNRRLAVSNMNLRFIRWIRFRLMLSPLVYLVAVIISALTIPIALMIYSVAPLLYIVPVRNITRFDEPVAEQRCTSAQAT